MCIAECNPLSFDVVAIIGYTQALCEKDNVLCK